MTEIAGDVADLHTPADLREIVHWLMHDPEHAMHGYQTVVLDGISTFCVDSVARSSIPRHPPVCQGRHREPAPILHEYLALPCIRVITGHARRDEEEIEVGDRTAIKITVYLDLPPRLRLFLEGRVDAFGYCYAASGKSQVWWLPLDTNPHARAYRRRQSPGPAPRHRTILPRPFTPPW